eukprot:GHVU01080261.1.p1 GENE.GHVU01080261.1~~GHVU01080261.1.p1  ORF type:complete len:174 (+),score=20.56 GHVU01080261.1:56-523(+)
MAEQAEERAAQLQEAVAGAAYLLDYKSHYEVSRCCRDWFGSIRRHYAVTRRLKVVEQRDKQMPLAAIRHVVGDRALESLTELEMRCTVLDPRHGLLGIVQADAFKEVIGKIGMGRASTLNTLRLNDGQMMICDEMSLSTPHDFHAFDVLLQNFCR